MSDFMPAAPLLLGALMLPLLPRLLRSLVVVIAPALALLILSQVDLGASMTWLFLRYDLVISRVDRLSLAFGYVFTLAACLGGIYSYHLKDLGQQMATLVYVGAALGVVFAGDWLTLYVFWEIMAIASAWLILSARNETALQAGQRYLLMHLFGGVVLLAGILWHVQQAGSLLIDRLPANGSAWLILMGVAVNAAIPPLHAWLADAYPEATLTGSVFLSAFTTKAAVYVLARAFPGWELLAIAGTVMAVYGVVFAFLENDIRRILSYHIISQVGYMVAGIGLGSEAAINGSTAHAFAHILYKGLLFMATGTVIQATGKRKLTELGGAIGTLPWVWVFYMFGALSISGFPLLSGFVSKSLVIYAAEIDHREWMVILLSVASVGTFLSVGLKLPFFTWFATKRSLKVSSIPTGMYLAMALSSAINLAIGIDPELLYRVLPFKVGYRPYSAAHLIETLELLGFSGLAFWFFCAQMRPKAMISLDVDWLYRKTAPWVRRFTVTAVNNAFALCDSLALQCAAWLSELAANPLAFLPTLAVRNPDERRRARNRADHVYDPDRYRAPVGFALLIVLASFISLLGWDLFSILLPR